MAFTSDGRLINKWSSKGSGDGQFNQPAGATINGADNVYVVDEKITTFKSLISKVSTSENGKGSAYSELLDIQKRNDIAGIAFAARRLDSLIKLYAQSENIARLHDRILQISLFVSSL